MTPVTTRLEGLIHEVRKGDVLFVSAHCEFNHIDLFSLIYVGYYSVPVSIILLFNSFKIISIVTGRMLEAVKRE